MSTLHVPARDPHGLLGGPTTGVGRRALRWLVWSFGILVPIVISALVWEAAGLHGSLSTVIGVILALGVLVSFALGIAAGIAAFVAIRRGERALIVLAALLPVLGLLVLALLELFTGM